MSSNISKIASKCFRAWASPHFELAADDAQSGGDKHRGREFVSHTGRLFMQRAAKRGKSAAIVFADATAAFYRAIAEEALGPLMDPEERRGMLERLGLDEEQILATERRIEAGGALAQWGVPRWARESIAQWQVAPYFSLEGNSDVARTWMGRKTR